MGMKAACDGAAATRFKLSLRRGLAAEHPTPHPGRVRPGPPDRALIPDEGARPRAQSTHGRPRFRGNVELPEGERAGPTLSIARHSRYDPVQDDLLTMKLHLAPLHGVTNRIFRNAYFRHFTGFDSAMAPFTLAVHLSRPQSLHFKDLLPGPAESLCDDGARAHIHLIPQLIGNDAPVFAETARILADLGYSEINWNLGCPYPMVANKLRGSGLLPYPARVAAVLDAACMVPGISISVKLRLGRSDPDDIIRLMPVLNDHPLGKVIIHPRVGTQMYRGKPDLEGFARAARLCRHTLVYNGDISDRAAFDGLAARFADIDEWMIGRGAVANPFLAEEIKTGGATGDRGARLRAWHDDLYQSYRGVLSGPAHVLDKMKEVWTYLCASLPGTQTGLEQVAKASTLAAYELAVARVCDFVYRSGGDSDSRALE